MPRKTEQGKRMSGAQQRRLKAERDSVPPARPRATAAASAPAPRVTSPRPIAGQTYVSDDVGYRMPAPAVDTATGAPPAWARLLGRIGEPPMNPLGNAEWANNASAALAHLALTSKFSDTLERQIKLCMRLVDRISNTQSKAIVTREIRELQQIAGIKPSPRPDADRLVPVRGGVTLRAHCRLGPHRCAECAALARRMNGELDAR